MALVSGRRLSSPANSAALGAVISAASVSAHQAWVAHPYQAGIPPNRRLSAASSSRIVASTRACWGLRWPARGWAGGVPADVGPGTPALVVAVNASANGQRVHHDQAAAVLALRVAG
jgi:hypothetical protein